MPDHQPRPGSIFPPPDVDAEHEAMLEDLCEWATGPTMMDVRFGRGEVYLPLSWLAGLRSTAKHLAGDRTFRGSIPDETERLVAICNYLEVDVEAVLGGDPETEIELVHEGFRQRIEEE